MGDRKKIAKLFFISAVALFVISFYSMYQVNSKVIESKGLIRKNSFVGEYEISDIKEEELYSKLSEIENKIANNDIKILVNDKEYTYKLKDLGIGINKEEIRKNILEAENNIDYWEKYNSFSKNNFDKREYDYQYVIDEELLGEFLTKLKQEVDIKAQKGKLKMNDKKVLEYVDEVIGFNLNIDDSINTIKDNFKNINYKQELDLTGKTVIAEDNLRLIDTKISSFTTTFDDTVNRKYNLIAGAKYINGKIIQPNEVFSFFENAGPYTKEGYVYYLGMKGNGVCQVATTLYNAELLAGLKTVTRYNHGKKSVYVAGGLDATVAVTSGYVTDFKFQNIYKYPVYISAYVNGGKLTIELWSNKDAKGGIEYKTESKKLGYGAYTAYRHAYKDGKLIKTENLGNSYYYSE